MNLKLAHLVYGSSLSAVKPSQTLPLPQVFDFENPEACARQIFAIMSNASGGFTLKNCQVRLSPERKTANLTCSGAHVFYADDSLPKLGLEEAIESHKCSQVIELGSVRTDQYGDGWKRAHWKPADQCA
ncbi:hypothetical protein ACI2KR_31445 [Pseudomonas luteola]